MILIFEQDTRDPMQWVPELCKSRFDKKRTWRLIFGWWSISYFASEGLKEFTEVIAAKATRWDYG